MYLENIPKRNKRIMKGKRLGRGYGSGVGGHTVGRGSKGQKSRTGHKSLAFFEGGNVAFYRRMPKYKGFNQSRKIENDAVNVNTLEKEFKAGEVVTVDSLKEKGIIKKNSQGVKILGKGEITIKLNIDGVAVSSAAKAKIEKVGGTIK